MPETGLFWVNGTPEQIFTEGFDSWTRQLKNRILQLLNRYSDEIESWMRENAPWEDDTGAARAQLRAEVIDFGEEVIIEFSHGVDYGQFLEFNNSGRYAIIGPALDYFGPRIIREIQSLLGS